MPEDDLPPAAPDPVPSPPPGVQLRLSEVIGALSYALDMTEGQPPGHCLRGCWIGMHVGNALGLGADELSDLYYTLLVKDVGCSSNAARLWELYGGDDLKLKHDVKTVDTDSLLQLGKFVLEHAGPGEKLRERIRRIIRLGRDADALANEVVQTRCERGADIVRRLGFSDRVADGVYCLDEHWNGKGRPKGIARSDIPLGARVALLSQVADVFHTVSGPDEARAEIFRRSGTWFDPRVAAAFDALSASPEFWAGLASDGLDERIAALEPAQRVIMIDEDRLDIVAEAFANIVDAKSSFTYGHSVRVARYTDAVAAKLGIPADRRRWLKRAALLHDIGKLGVSNSVLDKPGKLDEAEWIAVKRHAQLSENILMRISVFKDLAPVAAAHHERLDGKGYPRGLGDNEIGLETRIITVADIFDAITAERPYRGPIPIPQALAIMEKERGTAIDGACLDALKACVPEFEATVVP